MNYEREEIAEVLDTLIGAHVPAQFVWETPDGKTIPAPVPKAWEVTQDQEFTLGMFFSDAARGENTREEEAAFEKWRTLYRKQEIENDGRPEGAEHVRVYPKDKVQERMKELGVKIATIGINE